MSDKLEVAIEGDGSVTVILHDGTEVIIRPGKTKTLFVRGDNKLHLLDCQCPRCKRGDE